MRPVPAHVVVPIVAKILESVDPLVEYGVVEKIVGNSIESSGPNVTTGCVCWLKSQGQRIPVEVIGFTDGKVISMPLGPVDGVRQGDVLEASGRTASMGISEQLLGRVLDGLGRPIDGLPLPAVLHQQPEVLPDHRVVRLA